MMKWCDFAQKNCEISAYILLDNWEKSCYNNKAVGRECDARRKSHRKKFWRNFEKGVDKLWEMWYNVKAAFEREWLNSILKIEQCKKSNDPWDFFEKRRTQAKSKKCAVITQALLNRIDFITTRVVLIYYYYKEFDPGSGRTLAARLTHASRTENFGFIQNS